MPKTAFDIVAVRDIEINKVPIGTLVEQKVAAKVIDAGGIVPYTHTQSAAASVWYITHNLNRYPSVTVVDTAKTAVEGDITYIDANNVRLNFSAPFSGQAFLI